MNPRIDNDPLYRIQAGAAFYTAQKGNASELAVFLVSMSDEDLGALLAATNMLLWGVKYELGRRNIEVTP